MSFKRAMQLVALAACVGLSTSAGAITTDGNWNDWFSWNVGGAPVGAGNNPTSGGNNWNANGPDNIAPGVVYQPVPDGTAPGAGGQDYDIEAVMLFFDDNTNRLHFGMVTGFNSAGAFGAGGPHYAGDVFFGLGSGSAGDFAVTVGEEAGREGQLFGNNGWTTTSVNVPAHVGVADPYRVDETAGGIFDLSVARNVQVSWGHDVNGSTEHNFLEISFLLDPGEVVAVSGANGMTSIHWTMLCGNDIVDFTVDEPLAPMPEPATVALLGMGIAGAVLRKRFLG